MATADRDLSTTRVKSASTELKSYYWKFIQNYEPIEIFKVCVKAKSIATRLKYLIFPDRCIDPADYDTWGKIYERALNSVADTAVKSEIWDFFAGKAGATRSFIREMNDDTGQALRYEIHRQPVRRRVQELHAELDDDFVKRMVAYVGAPGGRDYRCCGSEALRKHHR